MAVVQDEEEEEHDDEDVEDDELYYSTPWYVIVIRVVATLSLTPTVLGGFIDMFYRNGLGVGTDLALIAAGVVSAAVIFVFSETANHVAVIRQQLDYMLEVMPYRQQLDYLIDMNEGDELEEDDATAEYKP